MYISHNERYFLGWLWLFFFCDKVKLIMEFISVNEKQQQRSVRFYSFATLLLLMESLLQRFFYSNIPPQNRCRSVATNARVASSLGRRLPSMSSI